MERNAFTPRQINYWWLRYFTFNVGGPVAGLLIIMPLHGPILQAETCYIVSQAEPSMAIMNNIPLAPMGVLAHGSAHV